MSKLSYDILEELNDYIKETKSDIEEQLNQMYLHKSFASEEEKTLRMFDRFLAFIEPLRDLWFQCAGCDTMINPDQQHYVDPASEDTYCMDCLKEGI